MIQIKDTLDDECKLKFASEKHLYQVLGLKGENECEKQEKERTTCGCFYSVHTCFSTLIMFCPNNTC
jgi:hypothetical protein